MFDQVRKSLNSKFILNSLSFHFYSGQVNVLLGPNGAGKTTAVRCLLGLLKLDHGDILVDNLSVTSSAAKIRDKVAFVPQEDAGYKSLTVKDNILLITKLNKLNDKDVLPLIISYTDQLKMTELLPQDWGKLSGGEKRAFSLIRALILNKPILVLDEPTAGLDLQRASRVRRLIKSEVEMGKTVVMSSHILSDIENLANHMVIIRNGQTIMEGTKEDIKNHFAPDSSLDEALIVAFEGES